MNNYTKILLGGTVLAVSALSLVASAQASPAPIERDKIVFSCEFQNNEYVTIQRLVRETVNPVSAVVYETKVVYENPLPLVSWKATLDSDHPKGEYTPESRCQANSTRLTNLASAYGLHTVEDIALLGQVSKFGTANHQGVLFVSYPEKTKVSKENVIFTLTPENRKEGKDVLAQFQIGVAGSVGGPDLPPVKLPIVD
ncbi:COP23 domain-containing protein [Gloeothece verrucosa]|uniref:Uncharacterized protein n=1 Tax=Gloeothece verrucosa (strain PCC 7822) TaxID=497965 RepID=E0UBE0_GLOV7|nr:COP23 domain-containing protein [Gloeothece verrucosa]ADN12772.1 conserved hypothetical protein [Gloeothece verrucosa PCC 7822]